VEGKGGIKERGRVEGGGGRTEREYESRGEGKARMGGEGLEGREAGKTIRDGR